MTAAQHTNFKAANDTYEQLQALNISIASLQAEIDTRTAAAAVLATTLATQLTAALA